MARRNTDIGTVGRRGAVIIPVRMRKKFGLDEGALFVAEEHAKGVLLRPARVVPLTKKQREAIEDRHDVEEVTRRRADPHNQKVRPWEEVEAEITAEHQAAAKARPRPRRRRTGS